MVAVLLDGVTMRYPSATALNAITLRVEQGEAVALLGPSGSGKTTVLRVVAGLDTPTAGDVLFDGVRMNEIRTADRNLAMVFQENVLFPFMNVKKNVGFPLSIRHLPKDEIAARVEAETRAMRISDLLRRKPGELSAGQQQLAQVARAMVRKPDVFLIDEPFARLDHIGTGMLRAELRLVQQGYDVTTIYATHDHGDAMALSDRIAVLDAGRIRQVGAPLDVYDHPADVFVATFVGDPPMAILDARASPGEVVVGDLPLRGPGKPPRSTLFGVRPEAWALSGNGISAHVDRIHRLGSDTYAEVKTRAGRATVRFGDDAPAQGANVRLRPTSYHVFDAGTLKAVYHSD